MGLLSVLVLMTARFGTGIAAIIASRTLMFLAVKAFFIALFAVLLPLVINNFMQGYAKEVFDVINAVQVSDSFNGTLSVTGFLAWLSNCFHLPSCLSLMISAFSFHLFLKMMPFSPVD